MKQEIEDNFGALSFELSAEQFERLSILDYQVRGLHSISRSSACALVNRDRCAGTLCRRYGLRRVLLLTACQRHCRNDVCAMHAGAFTLNPEHGDPSCLLRHLLVQRCLLTATWCAQARTARLQSCGMMSWARRLRDTRMRAEPRVPPIL